MKHVLLTVVLLSGCAGLQKVAEPVERARMGAAFACSADPAELAPEDAGRYTAGCAMLANAFETLDAILGLIPPGSAGAPAPAK